MSPIYEAMGKRAPWEYFSLPNGITEFLSKETMMVNKNLWQFRPTTFRPVVQPNWEFLTMVIPHCGKLAIFLPLCLSVKLILADFGRSKTAIK